MTGIAIKIWTKKDGKFDETRAGSNIKMIEKEITCGCGPEGCENKINESEFLVIDIKKIS